MRRISIQYVDVAVLVNAYGDNLAEGFRAATGPTTDV
jgi:hypothetical protein